MATSKGKVRGGHDGRIEWRRQAGDRGLRAAAASTNDFRQAAIQQLAKPRSQTTMSASQEYLMRVYLPLTLAFVAMLCFNPAAGVAQDEKPAKDVTAARPFLAGVPDWDEGATLAKAIRDEEDEEAIQKFHTAGLSYAAQLSRLHRYHPELGKAYRKYRDWIEAMQAWEVALVQYDPSEYKANWTMNSKRFLDAEAQLARAALFAHCAGEAKIRDELVAKAPQSPWIKAALAWAGVT
jgi:hypothetical protein